MSVHIDDFEDVEEDLVNVHGRKLVLIKYPAEVFYYFENRCAYKTVLLPNNLHNFMEPTHTVRRL